MKFITGIIACGLKLNKSFEDKIEIKKGQPVFFFVVVPEKLNFNMYCAKRRQKRKRKEHAKKQEYRQADF